VQLVPWSGYNALIQCPRPTPSDFRAPAGRYRVTLAACTGGHDLANATIDRTRLDPL
jgi:hypothetical protein